jgi:hypothetical protein
MYGTISVPLAASGTSIRSRLWEPVFRTCSAWAAEENAATEAIRRKVVDPGFMH